MTSPTETMRAVVVAEAGGGAHVRTVPRPRPAHGEALIRVASCGVCATDLKIIAGDLPGVTFPHILGHEVAGIVAGIERDTDTDVAVGDAVVVGMFGSCHRCSSCMSGLEQFCERASRQLGFTRNGGLAEYVAVPVGALSPAPTGVSSNEAALLADCLATAHHAVDTARVEAADHAVVIGAGGLGLHVLQFLLRVTPKVTVIEPDPERRLTTQQVFGTRVAVFDTWGDLPDLDATDIDVVVECAGAADIAWSRMRPGGRVCLVGYRPAAVLSVPQMSVVGSQLSIRGIRASTRSDMRAAAQALEAGHVRGLVSSTMPLERSGEALSRLAAGQVFGRAVVEIEPWSGRAPLITKEKV